MEEELKLVQNFGNLHLKKLDHEGNPIEGQNLTPSSSQGSAVNMNLPDNVKPPVEDQPKKTSPKDAVKKLVKASDRAQTTADTLTSVPVPKSGIGILLTLSLLMVFAITIVPNLKKTRLQILWGSLLGNYQYGGGSAASTVGPSGSSKASLSKPNSVDSGRISPWALSPYLNNSGIGGSA